MKFEEKLMKLRKEHALSQEELAEKLDVTRQTVSKWELGQSKPDMEKLMKISTFFNVSIECLTDDTQGVNNDNKGGRTMDKPIVKILIIVAIVALIFFAIQAAFGSAILKLFGVFFGTDEALNTVTDIFNQALDVYEDTKDSINNTISEDLSNEVNEVDNFLNEEKTQLKEDFNTVHEETIEQFNQFQEQYQKNFEQSQEQTLNQFQSTFNQIQQMQQNMLNR